VRKLAALLQSLMGYPVVTAGIVMGLRRLAITAQDDVRHYRLDAECFPVDDRLLRDARQSRIPGSAMME
jgi:hypothetical protein